MTAQIWTHRLEEMSTQSKAVAAAKPAIARSARDIALRDLDFGGILSAQTTYGVVWKAKLGKRPVAVKMVVLTTGPHYDRRKEQHVDGYSGSRSKKARKSSHAASCFAANEPTPFEHTRFADRKAMTKDEFRTEAERTDRLHSLGLGPRYYGRLYATAANGVRYALIVMERADCSVKDVILKRDVTRAERKLVGELIAGMHRRGITHGDCKPSNIVVWLAQGGTIERARFVDGQKVREPDDHSRSGKDSLAARKKRDLAVFAKHVRKNMEERSPKKEGKRDKGDETASRT